MGVLKSVLLAWLHSLAGTLAGGHFHFTWGLGAVVIIGAVLLGRRLSAGGGGADPVYRSDGSWIIAAALVVAAGVAVFMARGTAAPATRAAASAKPKTVVRVVHEAGKTIIGKPQVTGWEIVVIAGLGLVATIAMFAMRRGD
jgi:hypothetical protein